VIPLIKDANGTISKSFRKHLSNILGKKEIKELQKNSRTGHSTHTSESTNVQVQNIQHGN
jgi:protein required for attachment to host cells